MNRRTFLIAMAHATAVQAHASLYRRPHLSPLLVTEADVDPLMWPVVERINRSGWVWTMESCQGHEGRHSPMLGVVTSDLRFFSLWAEAARTSKPPMKDHDDPRGLGMYMTFYSEPVPAARPFGNTQVRISLQGQDISAFQRLAELVTP